MTLITDSLNPSISNGSWQAKRPEILKYSKSNLNRYFQLEAEDELSIWNEDKILKRADSLIGLFISVWCSPLAKQHEWSEDFADDIYIAIDI